MRPKQVEIFVIGDISKHNGITHEDDLPVKFKHLIANRSNKIDYILCTGNIVSRKSQQFLQDNCKQYLQTKGDKDECLVNTNYKKSDIMQICGEKINIIYDYYDATTRNEKTNSVTIIDKEIVSVCDYRIGLFHGHNLAMRDHIFGRISPCLDASEVLQVQKEMDADILIYGYTHRMSVEFDKKHKTVFINCGSLVGNDTVVNISPFLILNWVRHSHIMQTNHQFPIPIINTIRRYGKQIWCNDATFASLKIESDKSGQKCTVYSYVISNGFLWKQKEGQFEDVYNYQ